jgi:hypothetical protein
MSGGRVAATASSLTPYPFPAFPAEIKQKHFLVTFGNLKKP